MDKTAPCAKLSCIGTRLTVSANETSRLNAIWTSDETTGKAVRTVHRQR
jgi:hypothetical protein